MQTKQAYRAMLRDLSDLAADAALRDQDLANLDAPRSVFSIFSQWAYDKQAAIQGKPLPPSATATAPQAPTR